MKTWHILPLALLLLAPPALADNGANELVLDLAPFEPGGVGGEIFGVGLATGEVVNAKLEVTFEVTEENDWSMAIWFTDFPMEGVLGVSSVTEGWSGTGTFKKTVVSDALNGTLAPQPGDPFWSWFMMWTGGSPFELPGGGIGVGPMDGVFTELRLTLTLAGCPEGDPTAPWSDQGGALAGSQGVAELTGFASMCPNEPGSFELAGGTPNAPALAVLGLGPVNAPLLGGTLVPTPDIVVTGLTLDASGGHELPFVWPDNLPAGLELWAQYWFVDVAGPFGAAASNGIRGCAPLF